ncbi:hypothetical protein [Mangrovibacillus cuniculi]|uniref:DUF4129 domain-containing protein n=1 Tax=Mangrovibacillus cuniculi TaxID=2593652 RepID=A0A7S8CE59_9BACI|nr:hypothetical protein [Mangrovibacillus cuniculi]QPC48254.1 hypothetical protein G8O30_15670 [Mangrovibacillus cuniculi]
MSGKLAFLFHSIPILIMVSLVHLWLSATAIWFFAGLVLAFFLSWHMKRLGISTRVVGVTNFCVGSLLLVLVSKDSHLVVFLLLVLQLMSFLVEINLVTIRQQYHRKTLLRSNYKLISIALGIIIISAFVLLPMASFLGKTMFLWIGNLLYLVLAPVLLFLSTLFAYSFSKVTNKGSGEIRNEVPIQSIAYESSNQESMFVFWFLGIVLVGIILLFVKKFAKFRREQTVVVSMNDSAVLQSSPVVTSLRATYKPNAKLQKELKKLLLYAEKQKAGRPAHETLQDWLENRQVFAKDTFSLYEKWRYGNVELNEEEEKSVLLEFAKVKRGIGKK